MTLKGYWATNVFWDKSGIYVFKSKQHIHQFTLLDFHIFPGGFRFLSGGISLLPGGKFTTRSHRGSFETLAFSPVSQAVPTGVLRQGFYLQIKGTAISTIFAPTCANLTIRYHEIKVYFIFSQSYASANKHFQNSWFRYSGDCQILLKVNLIKAEQLLSIVNQINNNIRFIMEKSQTRLPLTVCSCHVTYAFQSKSTFYSCLNVKELVARSRRKYLDGNLQQINRLKTICPIYVKLSTAFFNKYIVLSCKKNMYHC